MKTRTAPRFCLALCLVLSACGCTTGPLARMMIKPDRTTYRTPSMRADAIRDIAARSDGTDSPEQRELTDQLARQIQIEPDPLVREAIVESVADFNTPLASQVLAAGLGDEDLHVRLKCCQMLGERGDPAGVPALAKVIESEKDANVRLAAVAALGEIRSPVAVQALTLALSDRDPAMQYAGVHSMKALTGRDFGGDVEAWLDYANSGTPPLDPQQDEISVARRLREMNPF